MVNSGLFSVIFGNRSLKSAGLNGLQRPDITAIQHDGTVEVWEYASKSQASGTKGYDALAAKVGIMQANNPVAIFHPIIPWEEIVQN